MNTIAIDCGASFIKGALINDNGDIIAQMQKQALAVCENENILVPLRICKLVVMVKEMIETLAAGNREVKLCISNEMHGFILAYGDGNPFTDYISWQKEFGAVKDENHEKSAVQMLAQDEFKEDILKSGMPLRAGLPSCNMRFLMDKGYLQDKLYFYTLGDYLIRCFTDAPPICHPSNAAATGMYHLENHKWNGRLIEFVCGQDIEFPEVGLQEIRVNRGGIIYHVYPAVGDQQAALLGSGLMNEQEISFNLGTGAQVSRLVDVPQFGDGYQIRPYFEGRYIKTIPHLPSGRALNVYIRFFEDIFEKFHIQLERDKIWEVLIDSAEVGRSGLICDMSFFENPITDHITGSICNIGEFDLSLANLMNAILKQMADNFIWAADQIQPERDRVKKILFSGGIGKKIGMIREQIAEHYLNNVITQIAENETLIGLYMYGKEL